MTIDSCVRPGAGRRRTGGIVGATFVAALVALVAPTVLRAQSPEDLKRGEELFNAICTLCHTVDPPALKAPPIRHVARHLRESFATDDEAIQHVVSFVRDPDIDRSVMPPMAIQRFGLMPAQGVPEEMVRAIAQWILSLEAPPGG